MAGGLSLRWANKVYGRRHPKPSLLRQAIMEQLPADAMLRPKLLVATAGSTAVAGPALRYAKEEGATLVVTFIREVALNFRVEAETRLSLDSDAAAQALFVDFLEEGHKAGVPIIPAYDSSQNAPEQIAELAALYGVHKVLIGSSRRGAIHQFIKGNFQKRLEALLPEDIPVKVLQLNNPEPVQAA
jgi:nucleotide-binding universal stress UspA family protein